jgi:hypothetical protein
MPDGTPPYAPLPRRRPFFALRALVRSTHRGDVQVSAPTGDDDDRLVTTVTVTPAPTHQPLVFTDAQDEWLANKLSDWNLTVHGQSFDPHDRTIVIEKAHRYCVLLSQGEDSYKADQQVLAGTERDDIDELTTTAMQAYPGCHG